MAFPTVTVRGTFTGQSGEPLVGAQLVATLDRRELYHGIVVPRRSSGATNDDGVAELTLFPNELGSGGSRYHVALYSAGGDVVFAGHAVFPASDQPLDLETYLETQPTPEPSTVERQVEIVRQQAARVGEQAADVAANAQTADTARQQAQDAADTATSHADTAGQAASDAGDSASAAANSADHVEQSVDTSQQAARNAGDSAGAAQTAAERSGQNRSAAETAQTAAETAATNAGEHADAAGDSAEAASASADRADAAADRLEQLITENNALRALVAIEHGRPLLRDGRIF